MSRTRILIIGLILVLAVVAIAYLPRWVIPIMNHPNVPSETYLYYDPAHPSPSADQAVKIALSKQGKIATPGELAYYAALGGVTAWCGMTSTGEKYSVPGSLYTPDAGISATCLGAGHGIWITGPKAKAGRTNISPFNCENWYQPAKK